MGFATLSIILGLSSAVVWGAGDFVSGLTVKRNDLYLVTLLESSISFVGLILLALILGEPWLTFSDFMFGTLAGLAEVIGVLAFYYSLIRSPMGFVAPIVGFVTALVPLLYSLFTEGLPPIIQGIGILVAMVAVWFLSGEGEVGQIHWREFGFPILSGVGLGGFLILIDGVSVGALYWPLGASRLASLIVVVSLICLRKGKGMRRPIQLWLILVAGLLDAGGNALFVLAAQVGRLDVVSVLTALYPAFTVFFAWLIIGERLEPPQRKGVALTLIALMLISA